MGRHLVLLISFYFQQPAHSRCSRKHTFNAERRQGVVAILPRKKESSEGWDSLLKIILGQPGSRPGLLMPKDSAACTTQNKQRPLWSASAPANHTALTPELCTAPDPLGKLSRAPLSRPPPCKETDLCGSQQSSWTLLLLELATNPPSDPHGRVF